MILRVKDGNFYYSAKDSLDKPKYIYSNHVNFELHPGEIISVLGPNGAGKTTLLKCVIGLLKWKHGETLLDDVPLSAIKEKEVWKHIGYVPQSAKMTFSYTVLDLVTMGRAMFISSFSKPTKRDRMLAMECLELVGIAHLAEQLCTKISGGELQLALIARTLVAEPKILVLDEPESHLDINKQKIILQTIKKLVREKGLACIINTHYANHAFYLGDKVLMVAKDQPVITGNVEALMTEENIQEYFHIEVARIHHEADEKVFETMVPKYLGKNLDVNG